MIDGPVVRELAAGRHGVLGGIVPTVSVKALVTKMCGAKTAKQISRTHG